MTVQQIATKPLALAGTWQFPVAGFAALLSLGAAGIHFAVAPAHFEEYWLFGAFFVVAAWLQGAWSVAVISRPNRTILGLGVVGNLALTGLWLYTRAVSVPVGPDAGTAETFGRVDELCIAFQLATVALAALLLFRGARSVEHRTADWAFLIPASIGMMVLIGWVLRSPIM